MGKMKQSFLVNSTAKVSIQVSQTIGFQLQNSPGDIWQFLEILIFLFVLLGVK